MSNLKKLTNKEIMQSILNKIEELGYTVTDVNIGNTYFLFGGNDDSVCNFHIKEIPGFLFGMWTIDRLDTLDFQKARGHILWCDSLNIDSKSEVIFFTQYERDLDKFKPSRSGFVIGLYRQAWEEVDDNDNIVNIEDWSNFYELEDILHYIKKHRIRSVAYSASQSKYIWDDDRSYIKLLMEFIHDWIYEYRSRLKDKYKYHKAVAVSKKFTSKLQNFNYIIVDRGECWHPRIEIMIRRKDKLISDESYDKDWDLIDKFDDKYYSLLSLEWCQYDSDEAEDIKKDKEIRKRFYWICNNWISGQNDDNDCRLIDYSVEDVADKPEIIDTMEKEFNERLED